MSKGGNRERERGGERQGQRARERKSERTVAHRISSMVYTSS